MISWLRSLPGRVGVFPHDVQNGGTDQWILNGTGEQELAGILD